MNTPEFQQVVKDRTKRISLILASKAKEYAREDRLSNFKKAGAAMSCAPEKACVAFWMKHVISICDLVNDIDRGSVATPGMWDEKIGDAINYLVLLEALVKERLK